MTDEHEHDVPVPRILNALHDQALRRAHALRREAIDDFWRGANAAWEATLANSRRSAQRLAHRLARHTQQRAQVPDAHKPCGS